MDDNFEDRVEEYAILKVATSYDLNTLYKIRDELDSKHQDLDLINKAIRKRMDIDLKRDKDNAKKELEDKKFKKAMKRAAFTGLLSGLFGGNTASKNYHHDLSDWEVQEINNGNYEPLNFEEEDMDEDDFYSDDLD